jgi:hypothetical protein
MEAPGTPESLSGFLMLLFEHHSWLRTAEISSFDLYWSTLDPCRERALFDSGNFADFNH